MFKHKHIRTGALLCVLLASGGCNLDLQDPNRPTEDEVFGSLDGIRAVAIGLQAEYGNEIVDPIYVQGLITEELGALDATFQTFKDVDAGTRLEPTYEVSANPWFGQYEVVKLANDLLRVVPGSAFGPGTRSGLIALARLYKAMAFGNLIQLYERIPLDVGVQNPQPQFAERQQVFDEILRLLQEARAEIQATPPSAAFRNEILAPGLDLQNTINAMLARYALLAGNQALALSAAQSVDLNVLSELRYTDSDPNALWNMWYNSGNAYQLRPEQRLRLEAEAGDRRVPFWVAPAALVGANNKRLDQLSRYTTRSDDLPAYLPDEMRLIQAEVLARGGQLEQARALINQVRTQCASPLSEPVACLPALGAAQLPTQQAVLDEILKQRRYELYLQGLRYSDLRRFGRPLPFQWVPIPNAECQRNENAPCQQAG